MTTQRMIDVFLNEAKALKTYRELTGHGLSDGQRVAILCSWSMIDASLPNAQANLATDLNLTATL